jgi:nucleoside-diphosphate-sugar epimerase
MIKKYVVLGSSGQIGAPLTLYLKSLGHLVEEIDLENHPEQDLRIANIQIEKKIKESDYVFFLAFDVGGSRYLSEKQESFDFINNNTKIMSNTFNYLKNTQKPFLFTSSQMSSTQNSPYGVLKKIGEFYTKSLNGVNVRLWNVYGTEKNQQKAHVINDFIKEAIEKKEILIKSSGEEERQFLHVSDCVKALHLISEKHDIFNKREAIHISSFKWIKIIELANVIGKKMNAVVRFSNDKIKEIQMNKEEPEKYILNFWKPEIELQKGLENIINENTI